jgi:hypothetical protein
MRRCATLCLALLGLVAAPRAARAADDQASPPAVIAQARSLDSLVDDARYLAKLAGRPELADQYLEPVLKLKDGKNGVPGVDGTRPAGLYGTVSDNLIESSVVVLVPVSDEAALLKSLDEHGIKATKGKDGIYSFAMPFLPVSGYLRFAHRYAYLAAPDKSSITGDKLPTPDKVFTDKPGSTVSGRFQISQVPDLVKQIALGQVELRLANVADEKREGESEAQAALRQEMIKSFSKQVAALLNEGGELALRLDVDRKADTVAGEIILTGQPKSGLQATIAELSPQPSRPAAVFSDRAALRGSARLPLSPELRQALGNAITADLRDALAKEADPARKQLGEKFYRLLEPTLKNTPLDGAFELRGPTAAGQYALVGGLRVADGTAIEQGVRDLVKGLSDADRGKVHLDAETAGNVKIHRVDIQKDKRYDADARKTFGDNPLYVAFDKEAAFLAVGDGGLEALKQALAAPAKATPPLQLEMAMSRLATGAMARDPQAAAKAAREAFGPAGGNDTLRVSVTGGKALTIRFELKAPVIKFLGTLPNDAAQ